jgi:hypothetical protein
MQFRNPSRAIPVRIVVNDIEIAGEIVSLGPWDMSVVIHSPVRDLGTGLHIPWFKAEYPQFQDRAGRSLEACSSGQRASMTSRRGARALITSAVRILRIESRRLHRLALTFCR